jgi:hypothetical protein
MAQVKQKYLIQLLVFWKDLTGIRIGLAPLDSDPVPHKSEMLDPVSIKPMRIRNNS